MKYLNVNTVVLSPKLQLHVNWNQEKHEEKDSKKPWRQYSHTNMVLVLNYFLLKSCSVSHREGIFNMATQCEIFIFL